MNFSSAAVSMKARPGCTGTRLEMLSGDSEYFADYGDDADEVVAGEFEEEQDLDDEPREMSSSWRKTTVKTEDCRDTAQDGKPWVPTRVASALKRGQRLRGVQGEARVHLSPHWGTRCARRCPVEACGPGGHQGEGYGPG